MKIGFRATRVALSAALLFSLPHAERGQQGEPKVAPASGTAMCSALRPADFVKAGVPVTAAAQSPSNSSSDDPSSAYCGYMARSGSAEFDIFYPAGDTLDAAKQTERTILAEQGGKWVKADVPEADSAEINLAVPGKEPSAGIAVRRGKAVFAINIPPNGQVREQLLQLAHTVLLRLPK